MGKIILEFDSFEEAEDARTALDGNKWKLAMYDLDQQLRKTTKYGESVLNHTRATDLEIEIAEKYREKLREIIDGYGLNLND
jgi:hypothetical protein